MLTTCQWLGIYPDTIESAVKSVEDAMEKLGFSNDEIDDMNDYAKQDLEEIGNWSDITNSIISCYFRAAEYMIRERFPKLRVDFYANGGYYSFDVDELPYISKEEIRADWENALDWLPYGKISEEIEWGFTKEDLSELARLHRENKHRKKIEDLLTDCNFHSVRSRFSDGDYDLTEEFKDWEE